MLQSSRSLAAVGLLVASPVFAQSFVALPVVDGTVRAFAAHDNILYIGGSFTEVGGVGRNGVAAIDLDTMTVTSWNPGATFFGGGGTVNSIAVSPDGATIYYGGFFDEVGGNARSNIAASTSAGTITAFAPVLSDGVSKVLAHGSSVYAIGGFTTANSTARVGFAGFDTAGTLTAFDPGLASYSTGANYRGAALNSDGSHLYVALGNSSLDFTDTNNDVVNRRGFVSLQTSDGRETMFRPGLTESGFDAGAFTVATEGNALYIGGQFDEVEGNGVDRVGGYTGEVYDAGFSPETGTGPNSAVRGISSADGVVYLAGAFTEVNGEASIGLTALGQGTGAVITDWDAELSTTLSSTTTHLFTHNGYVFIGGSSLDGGDATLLGQSIQYYGALTAAVAIPEPSTYGAGAGACGLLLAALRRRRAAA